MPGLFVVSACAMLLGANPYFEEGKRLHDQLEYERALERLELAREVSTSTPEERMGTLDLLARVHAALGRLDRSEVIYAELLALEPHQPMPQNASPPLREAFLTAKRKLYPGEFVRLQLLPSSGERAGVAVVDPWQVVDGLLVHRADEGGAWVAEPLALQERRATFAPSGGPVRFFIEAFADEEDERRTVATLGSAKEPLVVGRRAPASGATFSGAAVPLPAAAIEPERAPTRWPAWTLLGASAAAAAAGTLWAISSAEDVRTAERSYFGSDIRRLNERAKDRAILAHVAFGAAVLSGGAGAYLLWKW